ncbi:S-adenosyl-L-methionine-dependent methyltransferase [Dipodascopsis uninucleata]
MAAQLTGSFRPGDVVLLRDITRPSRVILTPPLEKHIMTHNGYITHKDIIGQLERAIVMSHTKNARYMATLPTLDEYVSLRRRGAQPIYAYDAATIVSLADLVVEDDDKETFRVLEAGTGHGSLTLAIARTIHSANSNLPDDVKRKALIDTLDRSKRFSKIGKQNVLEYRCGKYKKDVHFHSELTPTEFLWKQEESEGPIQYNAVFLDLPNPHFELESLRDRVRPHAPIVLFVPSVTQVIDALQHITEMKLPFAHDRTVELLPGNMGGSMRNWDVRRATVRSSIDTSGESANCKESEEDIDIDRKPERKWVCRPMVGERVVGGGFVLLLRRELNPNRN